MPELVPIRHGRMLVSAFTFYRGAAAIMAADLAGRPRTSLHTQLCGDAHLSNFGAFAAPDRRLIFSVNDFDETLPGPFEWDVKRLVASFAVAGRDRGFDAEQRERSTWPRRASYREAMREFAAACGRSTSGTPASTSTTGRALVADVEREAAQAVRAQRRQGAREGQPARLERSPDVVDGGRGSSATRR